MLKIRLNLKKMAVITACLAVTTMFSGCEDKETQPEIKVEDEMSLSQTVYADQTSGTSGITIVTKGAWSSIITEENTKATKGGTISWISISPDYGTTAGEYTIFISIETNTTGYDRTATIIIICGDMEISIVITQKATTEDGEPYVEKLFTGSGTNADPYQIYTIEQLVRLAELVNTADEEYNNSFIYYKLTAFLNLDVAPYNTGTGWIPIGTEPNPFRGHFDGNGYCVTGLYIDGSDNYRGLFGSLSGSLQNLGVEGVVRGGRMVGGLIGVVVSNAKVINCYAAVTVNGESDYVGGLTGDVGVFASVSDCYTTGNVSGNQNVGGVAGRIYNGNLTNCYTSGAISGRQYVGGIVGNCFDHLSYIENCVALNSEIMCTSSYISPGFGRITGNESLGTLSNNVAWEYMGLPTPTADIPLQGHSGTDISTRQARTYSTYVELGWKFGIDNPWKWTSATYSLPMLYWQINIPEMPEHLMREIF